MNSNKEKLFLTILPSKKSTHSEEMKDCLLQLKSALDKLELSSKHILIQTFFIRAKDNVDFFEKKKILSKEIVEFNGFMPPTTFIGQFPEYNLSLEVMILNPKSDVAIEHKVMDGKNYCVLDYGSFKEVYAAGLTSDDDSDTLKQSKVAFEIMKNILSEENLEFSDVVRQWNYLERLLANEGSQQKYQIFNDVRAIYYDLSEFKNGYPSATGIGMKLGGVVIDFIAISPSEKVEIKPLKNSRQIDAHSYSQEVLVGDDVKASPKFERGKFVSTGFSSQIFISGTAAIIGQETQHIGDVEKQTITTFDNIQHLVSKDNLESNDIAIDNEGFLSYIRVYVKEEKDIPKIKSVCEKILKGIPSQFLLCDICRDGLLLEMEGIMSYI